MTSEDSVIPGAQTGPDGLPSFPVNDCVGCEQAAEAAEAGFLLPSCPASTRAAMRVARNWHKVPDDVSDEDAVRGDLLTIIAIEIVMYILQELFVNCLSNRRPFALRRMREYVAPAPANAPLSKVGDNIRLSGVIDRAFTRYAYPRDRGDVLELRQALTQEADECSDSEFADIQAEMQFFTG